MGTIREMIRIVQRPMKRLERRDEVWYNKSRKSLLPERCTNILWREYNLIGGYAMNTLPPHAKNDNPQKYTIYALATPGQNPVWTDIKYIGASVNIQYRFSQHLSNHSKDQKDKYIWIQSLLAEGTAPTLCWLEEIEGRKEALGREQYWIRYAMSQGAKLFNRAITYTGEERLKAHQERAAYYAEIENLLLKGYFVKRSVYWYPSSLAHNYLHFAGNSLHLIDLHTHFLKDENGDFVSIRNCSHSLFDSFIKLHISVVDDGNREWNPEDRIEGINAALAKGCQLDLVKQERAKKSKKRA
jgi:predicted GIY-YIG superfamily endonuclease